MHKTLFAHFVVVLFLTVALLGSGSTAAGQCGGTHFRPDYRAVNKLPPMHASTQWVLKDWTGDGRSDFWNFRRNTTTQTQDIVIYPALAAGYWDWNNPITYTTTLPITDEVSTTSTVGVRNHVIRDLDSDGRMDLMIRYGFPNEIYRIFLNNGSGALVPQATITTPPFLFITSGFTDLTGDGRLEWIYTTSQNGQYAIKYSVLNPDGSYGPPVTILAATPENGLNFTSAQLADFDGDGRQDLSFQGNGSIRVLRGQGGTVFALGNPTAIPQGGASAVADINNDGRADHYEANGGTVRVLYGQSDATFSLQSKTISNTATEWLSYAAADLNGDARKDIIVMSDRDYEVHLTDVSGGFTSQVYPRPLRYYTFQMLHFEDFNADGRADLLDAIQREHRMLNAYREEVIVIKTNFCDPKGSTVALNFDGNMLPDLLTWNAPDGQWRWADGAWGPLGSVPVQTFHWGSASHGDIPAPGDFDGDGRTDRTVYRNSEGKWYSLLSASGAWSVIPFGLPGDIPVPNDYDGGGKTDLAVFRPSDGNWYIWYTETQQFLAVHWGVNGDRPVPADYNGDGKTDIGVFRPSEGNWYYLHTSDWSYGIFNWGLSTDTPMPADYDGDGKADLTVFRAGTWYIWRTSTNSFSALQWGNSTDIPIPYLKRGEVAFPMVLRNSTWFQMWSGSLIGPGGAPPVYFGLPNN